jgi:hypothetical protein
MFVFPDLDRDEVQVAAIGGAWRALSEFRG